jgi:hypothetical protein
MKCRLDDWLEAYGHELPLKKKPGVKSSGFLFITNLLYFIWNIKILLYLERTNKTHHEKIIENQRTGFKTC